MNALRLYWQCDERKQFPLFLGDGKHTPLHGSPGPCIVCLWLRGSLRQVEWITVMKHLVHLFWGRHTGRDKGARAWSTAQALFFWKRIAFLFHEHKPCCSPHCPCSTFVFYLLTGSSVLLSHTLLFPADTLNVGELITLPSEQVALGFVSS